MTRAMEGKVAVVTGASIGIGRATALAFAQEGARVVAVADFNVDGGKETIRMVREKGSDGIFVQCNVSKSDDVQNLIKRTVEEYGRLDFACNNAGIQQHQVVPTAELDEAEFDRIISVNLKGVFLCMKYQLQQMVKQGSGVIVNMSSIGGLVSPSPGLTSYVASKHGVIGLTKSAAMEYAQSGIRINAVCPAVIGDTGLTSQYEKDVSKEALQSMMDFHPVKRFGRSEEVASAVVWLCSDLAGFVTGATIPVDGGVTAQ